MLVVHLEARPLQVPLVEPFVIASGRVEATQSCVVVARVVDERTNVAARGIGEAATLRPVTASDVKDVVRHVERANKLIAGQSIQGHSQLRALLDDAFDVDPVARAGAEAALLDAWGRLELVPTHALLGGAPLPRTNGSPVEFALATDITIPIADPLHMGALARDWLTRGFHAFKVKVGKDLDDDARALEHIAARVPGAEIRLDANGAFAARDAMSLIAVVRSLDLKLGCFEQPCAADDLEGMSHVTALAGCPVVADESVKTLDDLELVVHAKAATAVNLKLMKHGGPVEAGRIGRAARRAGMKLMIGAMVETRLGLTASLHCARALGGVDLVDLDTALLMRWDPFVGGYTRNGNVLRLDDGAGLDVTPAAAG